MGASGVGGIRNPPWIRNRGSETRWPPGSETMKGRIGNPRWIGNLLAAWIGNRAGTDRKPVRLGSETRARIRNPLVLGSETREGGIGTLAVDRPPAGNLD